LAFVSLNSRLERQEEEEEPLHRNVQRFRGGFVFKAHRLLCHSIPGLIVKKKNNLGEGVLEELAAVRSRPQL